MPTNATANGGGISILGPQPGCSKSLLWYQDIGSDGSFHSNHDFNLGAGRITDPNDMCGSDNLKSGVNFRIDGVSVLNATTLGGNVVCSSLEKVGTLRSGSIFNGTEITNISAPSATPTITTSEPHGFMTGDEVIISGTDSTPAINGCFTVTVLSPTTFTVPSPTTFSGTSGFAQADNFAIDIGLSTIDSGTHTVRCGGDLIVQDDNGFDRFTVQGSTGKTTINNVAEKDCALDVTSSYSGDFSDTQSAVCIDNTTNNNDSGGISTALDVDQCYNGTNTTFGNNESTVKVVGESVNVKVNPQLPTPRVSVRGVDVTTTSNNNLGTNIGVFAESGGAAGMTQSTGVVGIANDGSAVGGFRVGVVGCVNHNRNSISQEFNDIVMGGGLVTGGYFCEPTGSPGAYGLVVSGKSRLDNVCLLGNVDGGNVNTGVLCATQGVRTNSISPKSGSSLTIDATTTILNGDLIPSANVTYDIGTPTQKINDLYVSNVFVCGQLFGNVADGVTANIPDDLQVETLQANVSVNTMLLCANTIQVDTIQGKTDATIDLEANVIPSTDGLYSLGNATNQFQNVHVQDIFVGGNVVGTIDVTTETVIANTICANTTKTGILTADSANIAVANIDLAFIHDLCGLSPILLSDNLIPKTGNINIGNATNKLDFLYANNIVLCDDLNGSMANASFDTITSNVSDIDVMCIGTEIQTSLITEKTSMTGIAFNGDLYPNMDDTYDIGSIAQKPRRIYTNDLTICRDLLVEGDTMIKGNLSITGNMTVIHTEELVVQDNKIILNSGALIPGTDIGVGFERHQTENDSCFGDVIMDTPAETGAVVNAGTSSITLSTTDVRPDDYFNDWWIKISSGPGMNEVRKITDFSANGNVAIIQSGWTTIPQANSTYELFPGKFICTYWDESENKFVFGSAPSANVSNAVNTVELIDLCTGTITSEGLLPIENMISDIGSPANKWNHIYANSATICDSITAEEITSNSNLTVIGNLSVDGQTQMNSINATSNINAPAFNGDTFGKHTGNVCSDDIQTVNANVTGKLNVQDLCIIGNLDVGNDKLTIQDLCVTGNADIEGTLTANGDVTFNNNASVSNKLTVKDICITGNLDVDGNVIIDDAKLNLKDICLSGNLEVNGNTFAVNISANNVYGNTFGKHTGDVCGNVTGNLKGDSFGTHTGNVIGDVTGNLNGDSLGTHTGNVVGDVTGNLNGDSFGTHTGNVVGDVAGNLNGNSFGKHTGDVCGNVVGDVTGNLTGDSFGTHTGNVVGDVTGNLTGDSFGTHTGNVVGDVTGNLNGDSFGTHTGNVVGDVTGNLNGDSFGTHTGNVVGDVTGNLNGDSFGTHTGNVVGDVTGNLNGDSFGKHTGDVCGNVVGDVMGNLNGDSFGTHTGNVVGNVIGNLNAVSANITGKLTVNDICVLGNLEVGNVNIGDDKLTLQDLCVTGNTNIDGTITSNGDAMFNSNVNVSQKLIVNDICITGNLDVDDTKLNLKDICLTGNLDVQQNTNLSNVIVSGNISANSFIGDLTGNTTGIHTGDVIGNIESINANVTNKLTVRDICVTGNVDIEGVLTVNSDFAVNGNVHGEVLCANAEIQVNTIVPKSGNTITLSPNVIIGNLEVTGALLANISMFELPDPLNINTVIANTVCALGNIESDSIKSKTGNSIAILNDIVSNGNITGSSVCVNNELQVNTIVPKSGGDVTIDGNLIVTGAFLSNIVANIPDPLIVDRIVANTVCAQSNVETNSIVAKLGDTVTFFSGIETVSDITANTIISNNATIDTICANGEIQVNNIVPKNGNTINLSPNVVVENLEVTGELIANIMMFTIPDPLTVNTIIANTVCSNGNVETDILTSKTGNGISILNDVTTTANITALQIFGNLDGEQICANTLQVNTIEGKTNGNVTVSSNLLPSITNNFEIGNEQLKWKRLVVEDIVACGNIFGNIRGQMVLNGNIVVANILCANARVETDVITPKTTSSINILGDLQVTGDIIGDLVGNTNGTHTGNVTGNLNGDSFGKHTGEVCGNVVGDLTGNTTGIHSGNVFGNLNGDSFGKHTGEVCGNVVGDLSGNTTGIHFGNVNGNLNGDSFGKHTGEVCGNVVGDLTGNTTGTHIGDVLGNLNGNANLELLNVENICANGQIRVNSIIPKSGNTINISPNVVVGNLEVTGELIANIMMFELPDPLSVNTIIANTVCAVANVETDIIKSKTGNIVSILGDIHTGNVTSANVCANVLISEQLIEKELNQGIRTFGNIIPLTDNKDTLGDINHKCANIFTQDAVVCGDLKVEGNVIADNINRRLDAYYSPSGKETIIDTMWTDVPLHVNRKIDGSYFSHPTPEANVTIDSAGTYLIQGRTTSFLTDATETGRAQTSMKLQLNGVDIPGTIGYMYNRNLQQGGTTCSSFCILDLSAGDAIKIQVAKISEVGETTARLLTQGSSLVITSV